MISNRRSSTALLSFTALLLLPLAASAQSSSAAKAPPQKQTKKKAPKKKRRHYTPSQKPPRPQPAVIEGGGWSLEPVYWFNRAQPTLRGGKTLLADGTLDYLGHANPSVGGVLSMPAGKRNSLRLSYFRVQGNTNNTAPQDLTLFSENYNSGDVLTANYTLQVAKLSWDYLSYTWFFPKTNIHLSTLWQMQFANIGTNIDAPLKAITEDVNGNIDYNTASGSTKIFLPTFGLAFSEPVTRHFRWWVKGSGFGIPHHGDIWDADAGIGVRFGQVELIGGEKAYHFKTSPQGDQYFTDTLTGAYVGVRWYWTKRPQ